MRPIPTHRIRRGKLVEIPQEWRGRVPSNQTMLQRKVKAKAIRLERKKRLRQFYKDEDIQGFQEF